MAGILGFDFSTQTDVTPDEFQQLRKPVGRGLEGIISSEGGPTFRGPFTAPIGTQEQTALQNVQGFGGNNLLQNQSDAFLQSQIEGRALTPESNPFLQQTIDAATRPIFQAFDDRELQERALFGRAGQKLQESSPFANARARSNVGLLQAVGDVSGRIAGDNFQRGLDRQQQAVNQVQATQTARFQQARGILEASALPRLIQQFGIDQGKAEFDRRMQMFLAALQTGGGLSTPTLSTTSVGVSGLEGLLQFGGGGGGGASAGGGGG
jgi:hypothetical protein